MRLGKIYRNYIRNNLFVKVIAVFAAIVVATLIAFSYFLYNFMTASIVRGELNGQRDAMDRVNRYLEQKYEWTQAAAQDIYRNNLLADNVAYLLKHPYDEYIRYMLNQTFASGSISATNAIDYFGDKLEEDPDIRNVILYSSEMQQMYVYRSNATPKLISANATRSYIPEIMAAEGPGASTPNIWVRKAIGQWDSKLYTMRSQINDKTTLKNVGQLLVYFDSEMIRKSLADTVQPAKGTLLVLTPSGDVMFDSSDRYYGAAYPYMDRIGSLKPTAELEEPSYVSTLAQSAAGYTVVGIYPKSEMAKSYAGLRQTIILVSALCIAIAVIIPSLVVINIARRTNKIVRFMKKVEGGDLSARLSDPREDELGQISKSFNEMLEELSRTIDREYKAEIRRKQTELSALQARVNPHFLYNTLEVIRMRAVSQGANDVGEMIYSLAALFRNSVRTGGECSLAEELETCRLYLELFRIRYKDKFSYAIECAPELAPAVVPKLLLQPLVENYIVHGLDPARTDNRVTIKAAPDEENGELLRIRVWNNGRGIDPERLRRIRQSLDIPEPEEGGSFGLRSVHDRLKLIYGAEYGIVLESGEESGTEVILRFPRAKDAKEEGESEHV